MQMQSDSNKSPAERPYSEPKLSFFSSFVASMRAQLPEHVVSLSTKIAHSGKSEASVQTHALVNPITLSSNFTLAEPELPDANQEYFYSRIDNPNRREFECSIADIEHAKHAIAFSSGSAAVSMTLLSVEIGSHVLCMHDVYSGTNSLFKRLGHALRVSFVDMTDTDAFCAALTPETRLVWLETPTNPLLKIVDIRRISELAHACSPELVVAVDNTFLSPYCQSPLLCGADLVAHSVSKYINGHGDIIMGVIATNHEILHAKLRALQRMMGAIPSPFDCYMASRGLCTLAVRMQRIDASTRAVAAYLADCPHVARIIYPGFRSHPQHDTACKQQRGFGGMIAMYLQDDHATQFLGHLRLFKLAVSLGSVISLAEAPARMTHYHLESEEKASLGLTDQLIRLSIGLEDPSDLICDLEQSFLKTYRS